MYYLLHELQIMWFMCGTVRGQGPHPGFRLLPWCSIDVEASFGSWCPYCQSHRAQALLYCTKGRWNWLLEPVVCTFVCHARNRPSAVCTPRLQRQFPVIGRFRNKCNCTVGACVKTLIVMCFNWRLQQLLLTRQRWHPVCTCWRFIQLS